MSEQTQHQKPVLVIGGPTASGKSSFAMECADSYDGVIINADSMQIYDELHVLTAHPSAADLEQFPHKLYGVLSPCEKCSAADWRQMVLAEIEAAHKSGKVPIIVGGTGFYIQALLRGLSPMPDITDEQRQVAIDLYDAEGREGLFERLKKVDPVIADKIDPYNTQRLMRAWEVYAATGIPLSQWQGKDLIGPPKDLHFFYVTLLPEREWLYNRCQMRFDQMVEQGALVEVERFAKALDAGDVAEGGQLTNALGFDELRAFLAGQIPLEDAIAQAVQETRRYAKRQMTWFRNQGDPDLVLNRADRDAVQNRF